MFPSEHLSCSKDCSKPLAIIDSFNHHNERCLIKSDQRHQLLSGRKSIWAQRVSLQFLFLTMTIFWQRVQQMILHFKVESKVQNNTFSQRLYVPSVSSIIMFVVLNWTQNNVPGSWMHPFQQIPCIVGKIHCFGWSIWYSFQMSFRIVHLFVWFF